MIFFRLNITFTILSFLSVIHLGLTSVLPQIQPQFTDRPTSELEARANHWTLRNMNFCTFSFNRNRCVLATIFYEKLNVAELAIFNYNCDFIGHMPGTWPKTRNGATVGFDSKLPEVVVVRVSEWWPTFDYNGSHYGKPYCVEDSAGGASGCWQSFDCEERNA